MKHVSYLPVVSATDNEPTSLVKLDIKNGRYFVGRKVRVAEDRLHSCKLGDLVGPKLLAAWIDLLADFRAELDSQIFGTLAFLINVSAE